MLLIWLGENCQVGPGGCGPPTWAQVLAAHQFLAPGLANGAVDTPGPELHGSLGHGRRADLTLRHLLCRLHPQMSSRIKRFPAAAGELRLKASRIEIKICVYWLVYVTGSVSVAILCLMLRPLCAKKVRRFFGSLAANLLLAQSAGALQKIREHQGFSAYRYLLRSPETWHGGNPQISFLRYLFQQLHQRGAMECRTSTSQQRHQLGQQSRGYPLRTISKEDLQ